MNSDDSSWQYAQKPALAARSFSPTESNKSPLSDTSTSSVFKPRIMYDKSYRTHEPLVGLPETEFESKQVDPNDVGYEIDRKSLSSPNIPVSPTPSSVSYTMPYQQKPDIVNYGSKPKLDYGSDDYAQPYKPTSSSSDPASPTTGKLSPITYRDRVASRSSVITDV